MVVRNRLIVCALFVLLIVLLGACVQTLPVDVPAIVVTSVGADGDAVVAEADVASSATPALTETPTPEPTATSSPSPSPTPVLPDAELARDQALDFLRSAYKLKLPANDKFTPIALTHEDIDVRAGYEGGDWQVLVGQDPFATRDEAVTVIVWKPEGLATWRGEVDMEGLVTTTVGVRMPRPKSANVKNRTGRIVVLPPEHPYDDYFEDKDGDRYGVRTNRPGVQDKLSRLSEYAGRVQVAGELHFAAQDYGGRYLLIRNITLLDGELPEAEPAPNADASGDEGDEGSETENEVADENTTEATPFFGPIGALFTPTQGSILLDRVEVSGEAEGVFENNVILRIENEAGEVLGQAFAAIEATDMGQRGGFSTVVEFENPAEAGLGRVALYSENAANGMLDLLAWSNVRLAGPAAGRGVTILEPEAESTAKRKIRVSGSSTGLEGSAVQVRVEDLAGNIWGQAKTTVGREGNWAVNLQMKRPPSVRNGRIIVYEINEEGGLTALASIDVRVGR